jgi:pantetheine-phosphate adenylyltransferase
VGHESLVRRGLSLWTKIVIAIGVNEAKQSYFPLDKRLQMIRRFLQRGTPGEWRATICLTVDFARQVGAGFILRGIRTVADFEYEKTIADMNRTISGIETLLLFTEPTLSPISAHRT